MYRYPISKSELARRVAALGVEKRLKKPWDKRAADLTKKSRDAGRFVGTGSGAKKGIWSEIKEVFIELQHFKCAYCETPMPRGDKKNIAYDVEHFRPKNEIKRWPSADLKAARSIDYESHIAPPPSDGTGYYLLAHDLLNYCVACKVCNSPYKSSYFPVAQTHKTAEPDCERLTADEKPFLVLPVGDWGEDPEEILDWYGPTPIAKKRRGHDSRRARVIIDFFELDTREDLLLGRCFALVLAWDQFTRFEDGDENAAAYLEQVERGEQPYSACQWAFWSLCESDRAAGLEVLERCRVFIVSKEPDLLRAFEGG